MDIARKVLIVAGAATLGAGPSAARQGVQKVEGVAGRSYAASKESGSGDLAAIAAMPATVAPLAVVVKPQGLKAVKGRPIAIATYGLYVIRSGEVSAYAGGFGSSIAGRRSKLQTALVGISDELATKLAGEAYDDLAAQLKAAGFQLVSYADLSARPDFATIASGGTKTDVAGQPLYSPADKPLKAGSPMFKPASQGGWDKVGADGTLVLNPAMAINYNWLEGSGTSNYGSKASTSAKAWFSLGQASGAFLLGNQTPPYRGTYSAAILTAAPLGTPEPFAVLYEVGDKSDNAGISNAMALAGLGSNYRQKKVYAVEADPGRYAALVRSAYSGLNAGIVAELKRSDGR